MSATVEQIQQLADDADALAKAAAIISRRYPGTRPDLFDTIIAELMNMSRSLRRKAREAVRS